MDYTSQNSSVNHRSQYGHVITTKNPFDDKQLEQTLKRLENEQKLRATEMFWKQRQFFIKKAFNDDNELKFPKIKAEILEKKETSQFSFPELRRNSILSNSSSTSRFSSTSNTNKGGRNTIARTIFPKIGEDKEELHKENHKTKKGKICFRQKKLLNMENQFIKFSSPDHEMPRLPGIPKNLLETENNTIRSNPVLLPMETREEKTDFHYEIDNNQPTSDNGKYQDENVKKQKVNQRSNRSPRITPRETTRYQKKGTGFEDRYNILTPRFTPKETRCYPKEGLGMEDGYNILTPAKQDLQSGALAETLQQRFITLRRDENNLSPGVIQVDRSSGFEQNDFKQNTSELLLSKSTEKLTSDELLLKLTMTLPMRLLLKTDQALNDLSSVLGFEDRRSQLLHRERSIVKQSPMNDDRFTKLMNTLEKQDKNLKL